MFGMKSLIAASELIQAAKTVSRVKKLSIIP